MAATSCEKEVYNGPIPGCRDIICKVGDQPTISFTTGGDWRLSSDATWCKFITSAGELQEMSGPAGTHTVTLKITDEGIKNQPTFANVSIKVGNSQGIIAKIERGPNQLYMRLYDVTDTPAQSIKLGYIDWIPFRLEANFRFAATEIPDWIEIGHMGEDGIYIDNSITGVPGEQTEAYARIINNGERERSSILVTDGYVIKLSDESGENTFEFPITYDGMGSDNISFSGPTSQIYGWEVSLDGKSFRQTNSSDGTTVTFDNQLEFTIVAQDDIYEVICFEKIIDRGVSSYESYDESKQMWINIFKEPTDRSQLTITIDESASTRHGMVMVVPVKIYNKIRADVCGYVFEYDISSGIELPVVKSDYQKYVIMDFTQHDLGESEYDGMYIYHSLTTLEIEAKPYNNTAIMEQYGVGEGMAYQCDFVNSVEGKRPGIIIDPRIEEWTTPNYEGGNASAEVWYKGEKLKISEGEYYIGENNDERLALHLWGPNAGFTENVYIVFKSGDQAKKLLVVTPPAK